MIRFARFLTLVSPASAFRPTTAACPVKAELGVMHVCCEKRRRHHRCDAETTAEPRAMPQLADITYAGGYRRCLGKGMSKVPLPPTWPVPGRAVPAWAVRCRYLWSIDAQNDGYPTRAVVSDRNFPVVNHGVRMISHGFSATKKPRSVTSRYRAPFDSSLLMSNGASLLFTSRLLQALVTCDDPLANRPHFRPLSSLPCKPGPSDARRCEHVPKLNVPILGLVENMTIYLSKMRLSGSFLALAAVKPMPKKPISHFLGLFR